MLMDLLKITKPTLKKTKKTTAKKTTQQHFNVLGAFMWLNLTTMAKNTPYVLMGLKRHKTKFGERWMTELNTNTRLYLPELSGDKYVLFNRGQREGNTYQLELVKKEDFDAAVAVEKTGTITTTTAATNTPTIIPTTTTLTVGTLPTPPPPPPPLPSQTPPPLPMDQQESSTSSSNIPYGNYEEGEDIEDGDEEDDDDEEELRTNFYSQKPY